MSGPILEIVEGPAAGRQIPLDGPLEIGRDEESGIVVDDPLVSRHHARIAPTPAGAVVEDLDSRNGTFVNGEPIHALTAVETGDHLLIGVTLFELRSSAEVAAQPSAVRPVPEGLTQALDRPAPAPSPPPPAVPASASPGRDAESPLDPLLDARVKKQTSAAPLAIFLLVAVVVAIFLATR